jgi:MFS family permease
MPVVVRRAGGSAVDVALIIAAPFIGHLLSPFFAYIFTGMDRVKVVAGTVVVARLVFIAGMLAATTPLFFALTTVTFWVITIANVAAYTSLMGAIYPPRERAQAMGKVRIGFSIASIASAGLAGAFIDVVPAGWVFAASAIISLPGAVAVFFMRTDAPDTADVRRPFWEIAPDIWRDVRYRKLLQSFVVFGIGNLGNAAMIPLLLVDRFDAPNEFIGAYAAVQAATAIVAFWVWGRLLDRGRSSVVWAARNSALTLFIPIGYILAPNVWVLLPVAVIAGISIAGGELTYHLNVMQLAPPGRVVEYATANSFLLGVRGTVAPFLFSALSTIFPLTLVMLFGLACMSVGLVLMARVVRLPDPAATQPAVATA